MIASYSYPQPHFQLNPGLADIFGPGCGPSQLEEFSWGLYQGEPSYGTSTPHLDYLQQLPSSSEQTAQLLEWPTQAHSSPTSFFSGLYTNAMASPRSSSPQSDLESTYASAERECARSIQEQAAYDYGSGSMDPVLANVPERVMESPSEYARSDSPPYYATGVMPPPNSTIGRILAHSNPPDHSLFDSTHLDTHRRSQASRFATNPSPSTSQSRSYFPHTLSGYYDTSGNVYHQGSETPSTRSAEAWSRSLSPASISTSSSSSASASSEEEEVDNEGDLEGEPFGEATDEEMEPWLRSMSKLKPHQPLSLASYTDPGPDDNLPDTIPTLIAISLWESPGRKLKISEIYQVFAQNFSRYRTTDTGKKSSREQAIRHALSLYNKFQHGGKCPPPERGHFWRLVLLDGFKRERKRRPRGAKARIAAGEEAQESDEEEIQMAGGGRKRKGLQSQKDTSTRERSAKSRKRKANQAPQDDSATSESTSPAPSATTAIPERLDPTTIPHPAPTFPGPLRIPQYADEPSSSRRSRRSSPHRKSPY